MGSIDMPTAAENGSAPTASAPADGSFQTGYSNGTLGDDSNVSKKKRAGILPLEVGTRVMCRWRDGKFHPVKVIERRKLSLSGVNDYEYYVHYTEWGSLVSMNLIVSVILHWGANRVNSYSEYVQYVHSR